jgi:hypothetical protein
VPAADFVAAGHQVVVVVDYHQDAAGVVVVEEPELVQAVEAWEVPADWVPEAR